MPMTVTSYLHKPWGETRVNTGTTLTTWHFTGQREDATIGLYFYGARYYDSALGRFTQPDTIVPEPGNPQALKRYSYVGNRMEIAKPKDSMDRFGLWSIPFVIVLIGAGELSRRVLSPWLQSLQPNWPNWIGYLITPLPCLLIVGAIGYWLFRRLDPLRRD